MEKYSLTVGEAKKFGVVLILGDDFGLGARGDYCGDGELLKLANETECFDPMVINSFCDRAFNPRAFVSSESLNVIALDVNLKNHFTYHGGLDYLNRSNGMNFLVSWKPNLNELISIKLDNQLRDKQKALLTMEKEANNIAMEISSPIESIQPEIIGYVQTAYMGTNFPGGRKLSTIEVKQAIERDKAMAKKNNWSYEDNKSKFRPVYKKELTNES